jgi:glucose/arabinose dehydrogenase
MPVPHDVARRAAVASALARGLAVLTACTAATPKTEPASPPASTATAGVVPSGTPRDVATDLASRWSILRLSPGVTVVSERDTGVTERVTASGGLAGVGTDESLWILTDNTDGRGSPRSGDDGILQVALTKASG